MLKQISLPIELHDCTDKQISAADIAKYKLADGKVVTSEEYDRRQVVEPKKICERQKLSLTLAQRDALCFGTPIATISG